MTKKKLGTAQNLIDILSKFPPNSEVVVDLNINNAWGFNYIKSVTPGIFRMTEYGNDFFPHQNMTVTAQEIRAICLGVEEPTDETPDNGSRLPATKN